MYLQLTLRSPLTLRGSNCLLSRKKFDGPKEVRAIEVQLYIQLDWIEYYQYFMEVRVGLLWPPNKHLHATTAALTTIYSEDANRC